MRRFLARTMQALTRHCSVVLKYEDSGAFNEQQPYIIGRHQVAALQAVALAVSAPTALLTGSPCI